LRAALATPGPVLIGAVVDPNEPPFPPKATAAQVAKLAESLVRGAPNAGKIALTIASNTIRELV
jgi:pyruvate dehydrogenase (quinone)/pyruvate oxidase